MFCLVVRYDQLNAQTPLLPGTIADARAVWRCQHPIAIVGAFGHWRGHVRNCELNRIARDHLSGDVPTFVGAKGFPTRQDQVVLDGPFAGAGVLHGPGLVKFRSGFHDRAGGEIDIAQEIKLEAILLRLMQRCEFDCTKRMWINDHPQVEDNELHIPAAEIEWFVS